LGGEVAHQRDSRRNFQNLKGVPGDPILNQKEGVLNTSLSLRGLADFPNEANVMATLRIDRVRFRVHDKLIGSTDPDDSGSRVLADLTPAIGAFFPVSTSLGIRASLARFFQTPTTSELANQPSGAGGFNSELEPQHGTGLEVGLAYSSRSIFHTDLTVFENRVSDELVPFQVPSAPGRTFFRNAGRSRHRGFEWAGWISPPGEWSLRWTYSFLDSRFVEFATDEADFQGNPVPGVPRHTLEGIVSWAGSGGGWMGHPRAELRGLYRSSVPVDDASTETAPPFAVFALRVGLETLEVAGVFWEPFMRVENILDRRYASSVTVNAFGARYFEPGAPRAWYIGLGAAF
jgi:iron complex outermembrane receptor protein